MVIRVSVLYFSFHCTDCSARSHVPNHSKSQMQRLLHSDKKNKMNMIEVTTEPIRHTYAHIAELETLMYLNELDVKRVTCFLRRSLLELVPSFFLDSSCVPAST